MTKVVSIGNSLFSHFRSSVGDGVWVLNAEVLPNSGQEATLEGIRRALKKPFRVVCGIVKLHILEAVGSGCHQLNARMGREVLELVLMLPESVLVGIVEPVELRGNQGVVKNLLPGRRSSLLPLKNTRATGSRSLLASFQGLHLGIPTSNTFTQLPASQYKRLLLSGGG